MPLGWATIQDHSPTPWGRHLWWLVTTACCQRGSQGKKLSTKSLKTSARNPYLFWTVAQWLVLLSHNWNALMYSSPKGMLVAAAIRPNNLWYWLTGISWPSLDSTLSRRQVCLHGQVCLFLMFSHNPKHFRWAWMTSWCQIANSWDWASLRVINIIEYMKASDITEPGHHPCISKWWWWWWGWAERKNLI